MMPDSPSIKQMHPSPPIPLHPLPRPFPSNVTGIGLNGTLSPLSTSNGRTPSPQSNTSSSQQVPPACGARQLSKLKRFLTTLQQFGADISPTIGERVRALVLALVNNHVSIEEFHTKLQEATNFPLRPFVIPFLKANLPLLQRELLHCARIAKQSPQHYLQQNDHLLLDTSHSSNDSQPSLISEFNDNGKRPSPDRSKENVDSLMSPHAPKRPHPLSPVNSTMSLPSYSAPPLRLDDSINPDRDRFFSSSNGNLIRDSLEPLERLDDDWKHVDSLLQCIEGMVDKAKRTVNVLQERSVRERDEWMTWIRGNGDGQDSDMKKRHGDVFTLNIRQTEERIADVKRRAEEAVTEVKRQAVAELQKAVSASEQKANELVNIEKVKMEKTIIEARRLAHEEAVASLNQQSDSKMNCWNCGRKANETCSGCNVARYCGSFCQHKDWESHHLICGKHSGTQPKAATSVAVSSSGKPQASATITSETQSLRSSPPSVTSPLSTPPSNRPSCSSPVTATDLRTTTYTPSTSRSSISPDNIK